MLDESAVPAFAPGVRMREDAVRGGWVVLAPERLYQPDTHAVEVLLLVDGKRDVGAIIDVLAEKFAAPRAEIADDVREMLAGMVSRGALAA